MTTPKWAAPAGKMDNQNNQVNNQDQVKDTKPPNYFKNLSSFQKLLPPALTVLILIVFLSLTLIANRQQKVFRSRATYATPTPKRQRTTPTPSTAFKSPTPIPCSGNCRPAGTFCGAGNGSGYCPPANPVCCNLIPTSTPTRTPTPKPPTVTPTHTPTPTTVPDSLLITLWINSYITGKETTIHLQNTVTGAQYQMVSTTSGNNIYNHEAIFEKIPHGNYDIWGDEISECDLGFDRKKLIFPTFNWDHQRNDQIQLNVITQSC